MIINSKAVSLPVAATMLGKSEQEVLRLSQYGYLEQSKPEGGKTRINLSSLEKYASRSGIDLQEVPQPSLKSSESLSVQDTMTKLGLRSEAAVHRLIQAGKLKAQMEKGIYKVDAGSVRNYILGA
ncbi:Helix-turn-helix domain protein [compost metagenome]